VVLFGFYYFTKNSEVPFLLLSVLRRLERLFPGKVKKIRTDNGTEFVNRIFKDYLESTGITHELTAAYVHEENGRAEVTNRIILENLRANLQTAGLSRGYWTFAGKATAFVQNCMKGSSGKASPWEVLFGQNPPIQKIRIFGCPGFTHIEREKRRKLDRTSNRVIFLGYPEHRSGFYVLDPLTRRISLTRSFFSDEEAFAEKRLTEKEENKISTTIPEELETVPIPDDYNISEDQASQLQNPETGGADEDVQRKEISQLPVENPQKIFSEEEKTQEPIILQEAEKNMDDSTQNEHHELKTSMPGEDENMESHRYNLRKKIRPPDRYEASFSSFKPAEAVSLFQELRHTLVRRSHKVAMVSQAKGFRSYKEALDSNPLWEEAYFKELKKLEQRGGLKVVKRLDSMHCIPFLEVLTEKKDNVTGKEVLKVRLAARGDLEKNRPDNVFSPTIGNDELRIFLTGMRAKGCYVYQGDCPGAYLNGRLQEPIYLHLPQGHPKRTSKREFVYKCPASIYGLAVAGRVWYQLFVQKVNKFGFEASFRNPCLFKAKRKEGVVFLQLYVDDFLFGSPSLKAMKDCGEFLFKEFQVKSTKNIKKFVGVEIDREAGEIFLHQKIMIDRLAKQYEVSTNYSTPMLENLCWTDSAVLKEVKVLQKIFGELKYIAGLTRPDICFAVNKIARKLQKPTKEVFRVAKRVLSYMKRTENRCISIAPWKRNDWELKIYCDASFADVQEEKYKSTGGYVIFLNETVVSWKSKKLKWVCSSTGEAEYLALYSGAKNGIALARMIEEFFGCKVWPITIFVDNQAVIDSVEKESATELNKHLSTKYFSVVEWSQRNLISIHYVPTKKNVADLMTKSLGRLLFERQANSILKERRSVQTPAVYSTKSSGEVTGDTKCLGDISGTV